LETACMCIKARLSAMLHDSGNF